MEQGKRLLAAIAAAAIIALVFLTLELAGRPVKKLTGAGWYTRESPFGSAAGREDDPAETASAPRELAPPERVMTNAATRLFSSPSSAGASGGLAGAEPAAAPEPSKATMPASRLSGSAGMAAGAGGGASAAGGGAGSPALPPGGEPGAGDGAFASSLAESGFRERSGRGVSKPGVKVERATVRATESSGTTGEGKLKMAAAVSAPAGVGAAGAPVEGGESGRLSAASSGGGDGGSGSGGSGGGGGGGGGGAFGGKVPDAKPKQSGKKPDGMDLGGGAAGAPINGVSAAAAGAGAILGEPKLDTGKIQTGGMFRLDRNVPPSVRSEGQLAPDGATNVVSFTAKMAVDSGAAPGAAKPATALVYPSGESLDTKAIPFIVLPSDFQNSHPDVKLGDFVAVTYGPKTLYAIVGDRGPAGVVGAASPALLAGLGVDPASGVGGNVRYRIIAGSKGATPPANAAQLQTQAKRVFERALIPVR